MDTVLSRPTDDANHNTHDDDRLAALADSLRCNEAEMAVADRKIAWLRADLANERPDSYWDKMRRRELAWFEDHREHLAKQRHEIEARRNAAMRAHQSKQGRECTRTRAVARRGRVHIVAIPRGRQSHRRIVVRVAAKLTSSTGDPPPEADSTRAPHSSIGGAL